MCFVLFCLVLFGCIGDDLFGFLLKTSEILAGQRLKYSIKNYFWKKNNNWKKVL